MPRLLASWALAAGCLPAAAVATEARLKSTRWTRLPTGSVKPRGWLETQARLQASALTSHLPLFWPNLADSSWLGGAADNDGDLHESTPYWLNGAIPLALQLEDAALLTLVEKYIDGILARHGVDGWLGPDTVHDDFWSRYPLILALAQYHEAPSAPQERKVRILDSALRFFGAVAARLASGIRLASFSASRVHDLIWAIHYFAEVSPPSHAQGLLALASLLHERGLDWNGQWFNSSNFARSAVTNMSAAYDFTHGVNNAQAVKRGVVWARQGGDAAAGAAESLLAWRTLMRYHGQPSGIFSADEHLAGRMPSRGTELCVVVESMWSLALLAQSAPTDGQSTEALDALEKLAFNALPGSLSDDLWSHSYLQFANSYQALSNEPDHPWAFDGPDAAMYGLAPNYECCTSNMHQGYPKLITHLFFTDPGASAIVSTVWAPSAVVVPDIGGGVELELRTEYPFGVSVEYVIKNPSAFQLRIRLPEFLREVDGPHVGLATVQVWVEGHERTVFLEDGFLVYDIPAWPLPEPRVGVRIAWEVAPKVRRSDSTEQGSSVFVGPLLLALDLGEQRRAVRRYEFEAADWNTSATQVWRYGLPPPGEERFGPPLWRTPGARPQSHAAEACPLVVNATMLPMAEDAWPAAHGAPGSLPSAPAMGRMGLAEETRLLKPYACSSIRISAFPIVGALETVITS